MKIEDKIEKYLDEDIEFEKGDNEPKDSFVRKIAKKALEKGKQYLINIIKDLLWSLFHEVIREVQYKLSVYNISTSKSNDIKRRVKQLMREAEFHKGRLLSILRDLENITNEQWGEEDIASIDDEF